jgi:hypothetical protein
MHREAIGTCIRINVVFGQVCMYRCMSGAGVCVCGCLPGYSKNRLWFTHSFIPILAACMCVCKRREMTGGDEKRKQGKVREGKEKEEEVQ